MNGGWSRVCGEWLFCACFSLRAAGGEGGAEGQAERGCLTLPTQTQNRNAVQGFSLEVPRASR